MLDGSTSINAFLDAAAARKPTPGGGAVAALTGALAASMAEMVINYSIGKKGLEAHQEALKTKLSLLTRSREVLLDLMAEDQKAFETLSDARKLPPSKEREELERLLVSICTRIPLAIAGASVEILEECEQMVSLVNYHLLSDLAVCADLSMACVRCALHNVRINLKDIPQPGSRARLEQSMEKHLARALSLIQRVAPAIWERHDRGA